MLNWIELKNKFLHRIVQDNKIVTDVEIEFSEWVLDEDKYSENNKKRIDKAVRELKEYCKRHHVKDIKIINI